MDQFVKTQSAASRLVMLRHGESQWNQENRFTGWVDVTLSEKGRAEALEAGRLLKEKAYQFHGTYTSVLTRAVQTHWLALEQMGCCWLPVTRTWRLNERHYGALQGLNKAETAAKHGEDQVKIWRRSYDTPPPLLSKDHTDHPSKDWRYRDVDASILPLGESLKDTVARVLPFWNQEIAPQIRAGKDLLIVAHGNSLRAIVQHLEGLTPAEIMEVNIPTGIPFEYCFDKEGKVTSKNYLGDPARVAAALGAVASQGKAK